MPETILCTKATVENKRIIDPVFNEELQVLAKSGKKFNKQVNIKDEARTIKERIKTHSNEQWGITYSDIES